MVWELERHVKKVGFGNYGEDFPGVGALHREVKSQASFAFSVLQKISPPWVLFSFPFQGGLFCVTSS